MSDDTPTKNGYGLRRAELGTRARSISILRSGLAERRLRAAMYPPVEHHRPATRGDCEDMERPCPYVSCRYHLYLDVNPRTGSIKLNFPDLEVHELEHSCALDVADEGPHTLEDVGLLLNVVKERLRQLEQGALVRLRRHRWDDDR